MLVYQDLLTGDELLSDSFPYREIENGILWEVDGKVCRFLFSRRIHQLYAFASF